MALNLDAIKNKLNQLNNQDNKKSNTWRPADGKQVVRIVPYIHRKENPFLELYFHYDVPKRGKLSPITHGNPDPIVEFADKLKSTGDKDDWVQGRKLEPKMRTYVPVIVRGKEDEGVKFWGFGITIYKELLSIIGDPDYGDITDLTTGRDIVVEFTPAEGGGFPKTAIRVKPNVTPATETKSVAEAIMKQPTIEEIFPEPTYEELENDLKMWLNPENDNSDVDTSTAATEETTKQEAETVGATPATDVKSAFNELFNN